MDIAAQAIEIEKDEPTTRGVSATMRSQMGWADSEHGAYEIRGTLSFESPFVEKGNALQISSKLMEVDVPYPFRFMEWWFVVVRRADGDLYFYHLGQ